MSNNLRHATLSWSRDLVFEGRQSPDGPQLVIDGNSNEGPSPMIALLLAAGGCTGADVVSILQKMRVGLTAFRIEATGTRREDEPRRYLALHFEYYLAGTDLDEAKARRAITLSIEKYCSVIHTLAPDLAVTWNLVLG